MNDLTPEFVSLWTRYQPEVRRYACILMPDAADELRIGSRVPVMRPGTGYASSPVFTSRQVGVWNHVCSTYDRSSGMVTHWFNDRLVFTKSLTVDQPIRIGIAEIENWGVPHRPKRHAIHNFVGRIDELTIWNTTLDEQEITNLYTTSRS